MSIRRVGFADALVGAIGAMVVAATLGIVRAWAWVTRTPYYKD